jgi:hypothetical protein
LSKISAYAAITSVQPDDLLVVVDVHDTSMAPAGTDKKMTLSQVPPGTGTASGFIAPAVVALTDGATISVNAALGNVFTVTLGGNRTMAAPSNPVDGQVIRFRITQDGTGSRTLTWNSAYDFGSGSAPALTTTAFKTDIAAFEYIATTINGSPLDKWAYLGAAIPQAF